MSRRLPPLYALRAFEATARLNSVSPAAEQLHVTHGAVSRQLKVLEASLGSLGGLVESLGELLSR